VTGKGKNMASKKLLTSLAVLGIAVAASTTSTRVANAQEVQLTGPLKGAPAVRHLRLYRQGRIELAPTFTSTILDEFQRTLLVGARVNYGVTDWLGIGVWGAFGAAGVTTNLTDQIAANANTGPGSGYNQMNVGSNFKDQVAKINYIAMPQLTAIPFRGKFALFQSVFADVDAYVFAGFGVVSTKERNDCIGVVACSADHSTGSKSHLAPSWGLGFNFYMNSFMSLGVEWRMIPFSWNRSGFDTRGLEGDGKTVSNSGKFPDQNIDSKDATLKFNQMMTVSLGFSFPSKPKVTD
jgi:outer membrane beta-barrel protein